MYVCAVPGTSGQRLTVTRAVAAVRAVRVPVKWLCSIPSTNVRLVQTLHLTDKQTTGTRRLPKHAGMLKPEAPAPNKKSGDDGEDADEGPRPSEQQWHPMGLRQSGEPAPIAQSNSTRPDRRRLRLLRHPREAFLGDNDLGFRSFQPRPQPVRLPPYRSANHIGHLSTSWARMLATVGRCSETQRIGGPRPTVVVIGGGITAPLM